VEELRTHRNILCIDLKSFYASVECALRGLDPFETKLVVADESRGGGSIVLSVSPALKALGVPNVCRIFEIPKEIDNIVYARPRMQTYLEFSAKVIEVYLSFVSEEDLYVYSVDECFLDVTSYLSYYKMTDYELAQAVLKKITEELGLYATVGIGPNMLISKLALDIESKKANDFIAKWSYDDLETKLWPIEELSKMWSIGKKTEIKLKSWGIQTIGDIAKRNVNFFKKRMGIIGEELWYHVHGIDLSKIQDKYLFKRDPKSYGNSQVLFKDYFVPEIYTIILEVVLEVVRRLRMTNKVCRTIHFGITYSKDYNSGFSRQITLDNPTNSEKIIYEECRNIFFKYYDGVSPIRVVGLSLSKLSERNYYQYSLFADNELLEKEYKRNLAIDTVVNRYGKNAITRASALEEHSTVIARNKMVGGHNAK